MSTLVYMKMLEQTPAKYDRGIYLLTLGRIDHLKHRIASIWLEPGHAVLEIGCGTGSLAALMAERGADVVGIDLSEAMLAVARKSAPNAELHHMTATEIDRLEGRKFDRVIAVLSFSELSEEELDYVLGAAPALLNSRGRLIVADEVRSTMWWQRILSCLVRWPLAALTFLLTQNTTRALKEFDKRLEDTGYRILHQERYLLGTLGLFVAQPARTEEALDAIR